LTAPETLSDNIDMATNPPAVPPLGDESLRGADAAAVLEHFVTGKPIDAAILDRVRARAAQVDADIRRNRGLVDDDTFQSLLDDDV